MPTIHPTPRRCAGLAAAALAASIAPLGGAGAAGRPPRAVYAIAGRPHLVPKPVPPGSVLGGSTSQRWPVVVELSRDRTRIAAIAGVSFTCAQPGNGFIPVHDGYGDLLLAGRRTSSHWGPTQIDLGNGVTGQAGGSMTARLSRDLSKASGTWRITVVVVDATGATLDTCDTGVVAWKARQ